MKLAEALATRADQQTRLQELKDRLARNVYVQEGDKPAEDPAQLLAEVATLSDSLADLIHRINKTNLQVSLDSGVSLTQALATRDVLKLRHSVIASTAQAASIRRDRFSRSEVRFVSTVDVQKLQTEADDLAKRFRQLDGQIQEANWKADLVK
jgi:hypothetical protein